MVLAIKLHCPHRLDLVRLPPCLALGVIVGLALQRVTHGGPAGAVAEGMAAMTAGFLCAAGANACSGWRSVAICLVGVDAGVRLSRRAERVLGHEPT